MIIIYLAKNKSVLITKTTKTSKICSSIKINEIESEVIKGQIVEEEIQIEETNSKEESNDI